MYYLVMKADVLRMPILSKSSRHGYHIYSCESYSQLRDIFETHKVLQSGDYVFRGQRNAQWRVESSLARKLKAVDPAKRFELTRNHLINVAERAINEEKIDYRTARAAQLFMSSYGLNPLSSAYGLPAIASECKQEIVELWSVAQHFKAATPLLDWTKSIYVALFFAYYHELILEEFSQCAVYALSTGFIKELSDAETRRNHGSGGLYIVNASGKFNSRLRAQDGLHTICLPDKPVEQWVTNAVHLINWNIEKPVLIKFELPMNRDELRNAMHFLEPYGIHVGRIFPDFEGQMRKANEELDREIDKI